MAVARSKSQSEDSRVIRGRGKIMHDLASKV